MPEDQLPGPDEPFPPYICMPLPQFEVTRRYDLIDVSDLDGIPLFRVVHDPVPDRTPEQQQACRLDAEGYYRELSESRHLARIAATELGFHTSCKRRACRREGRCAGFRHEFDWSFPGPWMVPCADTIRKIDWVRVQAGFIRPHPDDMPPPCPTASGGKRGRRKRYIP